jgi:hypothetical protein
MTPLTDVEWHTAERTALALAVLAERGDQTGLVELFKTADHVATVLFLLARLPGEVGRQLGADDIAHRLANQLSQYNERDV